jgi:hypothetical protein
MCFSLLSRKIGQDQKCMAFGKEDKMDRNYYYEKMASQREREISQNAALHPLFNDASKGFVTTQRAKQTLLVFAPLVIVLIYFLG